MPTIRPRSIGPTTIKPRTVRPRTIEPKTVLPTTVGGEPSDITIARPDTAPEAAPVPRGSLRGASMTQLSGESLTWSGNGLAGLYGAVEVLAAGQSALWERVKCPPEVEAIAAIPERFELKIGRDIPQAIIQFSEVMEGGKLGPPKYPLTIPHYRLTEEETKLPLFPTYEKGNRVGVITLADNSKSVFNCANEVEAERVYQSIFLLINSASLDGHQFSNNLRKGASLKTIRVSPKIVKFFSRGQKNTKPDWIKYLQ